MTFQRRYLTGSWNASPPLRDSLKTQIHWDCVYSK